MAHVANGQDSTRRPKMSYFRCSDCERDAASGESQPSAVFKTQSNLKGNWTNVPIDFGLIPRSKEIYCETLEGYKRQRCCGKCGKLFQSIEVSYEQLANFMEELHALRVIQKDVLTFLEQRSELAEKLTKTRKYIAKLRANN